jgi:hypothetical protein
MLTAMQWMQFFDCCMSTVDARWNAHRMQDNIPYIYFHITLSNRYRMLLFMKIIFSFEVGDRVFWPRCIGGSYKEVTLTEEYLTYHLHRDLSFQQGAAIGVPYFTAYRALVTKAKVLAGEKVLIHGASGAVSVDYLCIAVMYYKEEHCLLKFLTLLSMTAVFV